MAPPAPMQSVRQGSYIAPVGSYVAPPAPMPNSYCTPQSSSRGSAQAVAVTHMAPMQGSHSLTAPVAQSAQPLAAAQPAPVPLGGPTTILLSAAKPVTAQPALSAAQPPPVAQQAPAAQPLAADAGRCGTAMRPPMKDGAAMLPSAQVGPRCIETWTIYMLILIFLGTCIVNCCD